VIFDIRVVDLSYQEIALSNLMRKTCDRCRSSIAATASHFSLDIYSINGQAATITEDDVVLWNGKFEIKFEFTLTRLNAFEEMESAKTTHVIILVKILRQVELMQAYLRGGCTRSYKAVSKYSKAISC